MSIVPVRHPDETSPAEKRKRFKHAPLVVQTEEVEVESEGEEHNEFPAKERPPALPYFFPPTLLCAWVQFVLLCYDSAGLLP